MFSCFFFLKVILPGGNTSFDVYFLARDQGNAESVLYINTNKGIIKFIVMGVGVPNDYKLRPILNARIPLNSSFTSLIQLHNPNNFSLQVLEIYTSDDDLHLELPAAHLDSTTLSNSLLYDNDQTTPRPQSNNRDNIITQTRSFLNPNYHVSRISDQKLWVIIKKAFAMIYKNTQSVVN